jgi:F0F1-type ATP synthase membrane subunit b/b'
MEGLRVSDILLHIINIFILYYLLRSILWTPVSRFLADRAARIENELKDPGNTLAEAPKQTER